MFSEEPKWAAETTDASMFGSPAEDDPVDDWDEWNDFELGPQRGDVWDAFELDDELEEPQPEYGDFWPQPDDEEI